MSTSSQSLPKILSAGFQRSDFVAAIVDALDWVPELKHEGLVCTHLSSSLRKLGFRSTREVTVGKRRFDIKVEGIAVEAKYHLEGDIHDVLNSLQPDSRYIYNPRGWNSAAKAIHDELSRGTPSWFIWMICVRDPASTEDYIYPKLREKLMANSTAVDFETSIQVVERLLSVDVVSAFQSRAKAENFSLPTIRGRHSALVSQLYHVSPI